MSPAVIIMIEVYCSDTALKAQGKGVKCIPPSNFSHYDWQPTLKFGYSLCATAQATDLATAQAIAQNARTVYGVRIG